MFPELKATLLVLVAAMTSACADPELEFRPLVAEAACSDCERVEYRSPRLAGTSHFVASKPLASIAAREIASADVWSASIGRQDPSYDVTLFITGGARERIRRIARERAEDGEDSPLLVFLGSDPIAVLAQEELGLGFVVLSDFATEQGAREIVEALGVETIEGPNPTGEEIEAADEGFAERHPELHERVERARKALEQEKRR